VHADEITLPQKWIICVALLMLAALPQPPSSYTFIGLCSKRGLPRCTDCVGRRYANIRRLSLDALYSRRATRIDPLVILRTDYLLVLPIGVFSQKTMDAHC
jgi:hypothetical protein